MKVAPREEKACLSPIPLGDRHKQAIAVLLRPCRCRAARVSALGPPPQIRCRSRRRSRLYTAELNAGIIGAGTIGHASICIAHVGNVKSTPERIQRHNQGPCPNRLDLANSVNNQQHI